VGYERTPESREGVWEEAIVVIEEEHERAIHMIKPHSACARQAQSCLITDDVASPAARG
jgi:hypothetical protein